MQRRQHGAERISLRGSYPLAFVLGVPMPATVKDPPTQMWIQYSSGALLLRGDGTFDLNVDGETLTGTVHAANWPGDGPISDGKIEGDRVRFTMVGTLPYTTNGGVGYPKLCFNGTRHGSEMKLETRWAEARRPCDDGKLYPMAAKKLLD